MFLCGCDERTQQVDIRENFLRQLHVNVHVDPICKNKNSAKVGIRLTVVTQCQRQSENVTLKKCAAGHGWSKLRRERMGAVQIVKDKRPGSSFNPASPAEATRRV